jgi:hypothetical protein
MMGAGAAETDQETGAADCIPMWEWKDAEMTVDRELLREFLQEFWLEVLRPLLLAGVRPLFAAAILAASFAPCYGHWADKDQMMAQTLVQLMFGIPYLVNLGACAKEFVWKREVEERSERVEAFHAANPGLPCVPPSDARLASGLLFNTAVFATAFLAPFVAAFAAAVSVPSAPGHELAVTVVTGVMAISQITLLCLVVQYLIPRTSRWMYKSIEQD